MSIILGLLRERLNIPAGEGLESLQELIAQLKHTPTPQFRSEYIDPFSTPQPIAHTPTPPPVVTTYDQAWLLHQCDTLVLDIDSPIDAIQLCTEIFTILRREGSLIK